MSNDTAAQIVSNYTTRDFSGSGAAHPVAGLLLASDGNYWGTTAYGGANNRGSIFMMTPAGVITVVYSFNGTDGEQPNSRLVENVDGTLFGTTSVGGTSSSGTAFRFNPTSGALTPLHSFTGDAIEGAFPNGIIRASDGNFYGTTQQAVFKISSPPTLVFSVLHTFNLESEGGSALNSVVEGSDGLLYGTMYGLGGVPNQDLARIYSISKAGGIPQILYQASRTDGYSSTGALIQGADGALYGTARDGGAFWNTTGCAAVGNCGTVFRFDLTTQTYTVLFSYDGGSDGRDPEGGLIAGTDGFLYGTTAAGSNLGGGTVFRIGTSGGLTTIHQFDAADASSPRGELIEPSGGLFFGTTFTSSTSQGVIYSFTVGSPTTTALAPSPTTSLFGQAVTLTATVSASSSIATGTVEFFDNATSIGKTALNSGTATLVTSTMSVGTHAVSAQYLGEGTLLASTSPNASVTVSRAQTTTTLGTSPNPSSRRQIVTLTATVAPVAPGAGIATGQVQFLEGKKKLGTAPLVNGVATLQVIFNTMGAHDLTGTYAGDGNFIGAASAVFTHTVNK